MSEVRFEGVRSLLVSRRSHVLLGSASVAALLVAAPVAIVPVDRSAPDGASTAKGLSLGIKAANAQVDISTSTTNTSTIGASGANLSTSNTVYTLNSPGSIAASTAAGLNITLGNSTVNLVNYSISQSGDFRAVNIAGNGTVLNLSGNSTINQTNSANVAVAVGTSGNQIITIGSNATVTNSNTTLSTAFAFGDFTNITLNSAGTIRGNITIANTTADGSAAATFVNLTGGSLTGNVILAANSYGRMDVNGTVNITGNVGANITAIGLFTVGSAANLTVAGNISAVNATINGTMATNGFINHTAALNLAQNANLTLNGTFTTSAVAITVTTNQSGTLNIGNGTSANTVTLGQAIGADGGRLALITVANQSTFALGGCNTFGVNATLNGNGAVTMAAGSLNLTGNLTLNSNSSVNLTAGGNLNASTINIASNGTLRLNGGGNVTATTLNVTGNGTVFVNAAGNLNVATINLLNASSTINLTNGAGGLINGNIAGSSGTGIVNVNVANYSAAANSFIGNNAATRIATLNVTDPGSASSTLNMGNNNLFATTIIVNTNQTLQANGTGTNSVNATTLNLSGNGSATLGNVTISAVNFVSSSGTPILNANGTGTVSGTNSSSYGVVATTTNNTGTVTVTGAGNHTFTTIGNSTAIVANVNQSAGNVTVGNIAAATVNLSGTSNFTQTGNISTATLFNSTIGTGNATVGNIALGSGSLTKTGNGNLTIGSVNASAATFQVAGGNITINNASSFNGAAGLNISAAGNVSLGGNISGNITAGTDAAGNVTFTGNVTTTGGVGASTANELNCLTVAANGTWRPTAGQTIFTCNTNIVNGGTLVIVGNTTLNSSTTFVQNGTLTIQGGNLTVNTAATQSFAAGGSTTFIPTSTTSNVTGVNGNVAIPVNAAHRVAVNVSCITIASGSTVVINTTNVDFTGANFTTSNTSFLTFTRNASNITIGTVAGGYSTAVASVVSTAAPGTAGLGTALNTASASAPAGSDVATILSRIQTLTGSDLSNAIAAIQPDSTGGGASGAAASAAGTAIVVPVTSRTNSVRVANAGGEAVETGFSAGLGGRPTGVWGQAFGSWGDKNTSGGFNGYKSDTVGMAFGADSQITDSFLLVLFGGIADSDVDPKNNTTSSNTSIKTYSFGLYSNYNINPQLYVEGLALFNRHNYKSKRSAAAAGGGDVRGEWDGNQWTARGAVGYVIPTASGWTVTPNSFLQYTTLRQDSYSETGAGALRVSQKNINTTTAGVGARFNGTYTIGGGWSLVPEVRLGVQQDFGTSKPSSTNAFVTVPGASWTTEGKQLSKTAGTYGVGATFRANSGLDLSANYDGEKRSAYISHTVLARVRQTF